MRSWKAVLSAVLLVIITFGALAAVAGGMVYAVWTRPHAYDRALDREQAYPAVTDLLLGWMEQGLPNGRDAARYLRTSLSPEWVQAHIQDILGQASDYVRGRSDSLPVIPVADLKELLYQSMPEAAAQQARRDEAWLLLSPLPDSAVWSDFMSPESLYSARDAVGTLRTVLLILGGVILGALGLWWALEKRIARALSWLGGALLAGALVGLMLCAAAWFVIPRLLVFWQTQQGLMNWGITADSAASYLRGFTGYAILTLGAAYVGAGILGYILMQAAPSRDDEADRPALKVLKGAKERPVLKYPL